MKRTNALALFAILLAGLFHAGSAAAQNVAFVDIYNNSGEELRACIYPADDSETSKPLECFEMEHREAVLWIRGKYRSDFRLKVFTPAPGDKLLVDQVLPGGTNTIGINKDGKISFGGNPRSVPVTKYKLKVCNQRFDEKITFALSFETDAAFISEGWWSVGKGKCVEISVSERLKQSINLVYGELPRTYFYARTHGDKPQFWYWSGIGDGKSFCIDEKKSFKLSGKRTSAGTPPQCTASDQKTAAFRRVADPKADEDIYYLNF